MSIDRGGNHTDPGSSSPQLWKKQIERFLKSIKEQIEYLTSINTGLVNNKANVPAKINCPAL